MDETLAGVVLAQGVPFEGTPALKRAGVTLQLTREYDSYLFRNRLGEVVACNIFYVWYFFVFVPASQIAGCIAALKELNKINR